MDVLTGALSGVFFGVALGVAVASFRLGSRRPSLRYARNVFVFFVAMALLGFAAAWVFNLKIDLALSAPALIAFGLIQMAASGRASGREGGVQASI